MKNYFNYILIVLISLVTFGCTDDLNTKPLVELSLEELLERDPDAVVGILSRLYASFALSGPDGPGSSDISDDAGESPFLRGIVNLQDFTADGMKNRWGDDGLDQLTTTSDWTSNNKFFRYLYNRAYYTIPQCNNLLNVLTSVDVTNEEAVNAEVRFLRALAYYYIIDVFGKGVLVTENEVGISTPLPEASRTELFNFVESELLAIEPALPARGEISDYYGRATNTAAQMLLSKLYMNAEVYTGTARYDDAAIYVNKVLNEGGYMLASDFRMNFSADNNTSPEIIFPLIADAVISQSFGNTTYIVNGSLSTETMSPNDFGSTEGWTGHRATSAWYGLYCGGVENSDQLTNCDDIRSQLFWIGKDLGTDPDTMEPIDLHSFNMLDYREWTDGYPSTKFRNTNFNGTSTSTSFSGTDFPLFRLADAYLMYAELAIRGAANTSNSEALNYVNLVRNRSNASSITSSQLTEDFIINERARELNLEGHRRSDLIRFNKFTGGSYIWPWKGGTVNGTSISDDYKVFPIPATALQANPNLTQNPGY
ncbi:RagB/SusD family nutrient uptake outer membrane protein [Winogradskyella bathintestinalis]|uniref:RagB/SusD family nutrient uptake outer membrane protein n=1 Tax=Winogradskyella bathintestinalis TaxID=3035208 RepID=A0ABT7ZQE2_9FLAO|nr:RagB/SusD family nutrient uptake outer membrane protein [Winogradskyella bathintestinalis]MDN3491225.1 RagB/SusD family nutrient uptake outer membrane protein [Winogradskyella bathintestinalis]